MELGAAAEVAAERHLYHPNTFTRDEVGETVIERTLREKAFRIIHEAIVWVIKAKGLLQNWLAAIAALLCRQTLAMRSWGR